MGPSGSGKTTLLSLLAGLDLPTAGHVEILGQDLSKMSEEERTKFRAENMGFVFQSFRLVPTLTALENVQIPLEILGEKKSVSKAKVLLERVGLGSRLDHFPSQLSGGEQQRVAIARAFVAKPKILFADEPTGHLDSLNGGKVLELLRELREENNSSLFVVTHDPSVASLGTHHLKIKDGVMNLE
jgi:putative ABC transport system ATP-binding protein